MDALDWQINHGVQQAWRRTLSCHWFNGSSSKLLIKNFTGIKRWVWKKHSDNRLIFNLKFCIIHKWIIFLKASINGSLVVEATSSTTLTIYNFDYADMPSNFETSIYFLKYSSPLKIYIFCLLFVHGTYQKSEPIQLRQKKHHSY